jgi:hypothetical protein
MKRLSQLLLIVLCVSILLAACGKNKSSVTTMPTTALDTTPTEITVEVTTEPTTVLTTEPMIDSPMTLTETSEDVTEPSETSSEEICGNSDAVTYYREQDKTEDTYYKLYLTIREDNSIDLSYTLYKKNSSFEGGRITSYTKYRSKTSAWDEISQSLTVSDSSGEIECTITIADSNAIVHFENSTTWHMFVGEYKLYESN